MSRNYALLIGINQYQFLKSLNYAEQDAQRMSDFLKTEAKFDKTYLFTDTSPDQPHFSTKPTRNTIRYFFREQAEEGKFLTKDDSFWFFFSGHGLRHSGYDYLMPSDGDPRDPRETAIRLDWIRSKLLQSGAGSLVIILDACRNEGGKGGGFGARLEGTTTIYSCRAEEMSWEISELGRGVFTHSLIENLQEQIQQDKGQTISEIESYLRIRVSALAKQYQKPSQTPHIQCDSISRSTQILLPKFAVVDTVKRIRTLALQAEANSQWERAIELWKRLSSLVTSPKERANIAEHIRMIEQRKMDKPQIREGGKGAPKPNKFSQPILESKTVKSQKVNFFSIKNTGFFALTVSTVFVWIFIGYLSKEHNSENINVISFCLGAIGGMTSGALAALSLNQLKALRIAQVIPPYLLIGFAGGAIGWTALSSWLKSSDFMLAGFFLGITTAIIIMIWSNWKSKH